MKKKETFKNLVKMNASAGSGKTYTLTDRFVNLLFESDTAPCESCNPVKNKSKFNFSELLAITFTNLAANQMKEKVIAKLKQYALGEVSSDEAACTQNELKEKAEIAHAVLNRIFQQYGALNIRTIDSLLNQIIGLFALELGYSPQFETSFDSDKYIKELYAKLAEQSILNEHSGGACEKNYAPFFRKLCEAKFENSTHANFMAKGVLQEQIINVVSYCIKNNTLLPQKDINELEKHYKFFEKRKESLLQEIDEFACKIKTCIEKENILVKKLFVTALEDVKNERKFTSAMLKKESFEEVVTVKNTGEITKASEYYQELQEAVKKFNTAVTMYEQYAVLLPAATIASELSLRLDNYEKQMQCINTQKMPHIIASLLGEEDSPDNAFLAQKKQEDQLVPAAFCRLGTRIKHILYDEFQDTSSAQWNALKGLSGEALAGGGSVFFVGDVKQAIYGWRGGKASLFTDAPEELKHQAIDFSLDENLPCNWRSAENIIAWNNSFFRNLADEAKNSDIALLFPASEERELCSDIITKTRESIKESYRQVQQDLDKNRLAQAENKGVVEVHSLRESDNFFDVAVLCLLPEMVRNLYKKYKNYSKIAILTVNNNQASLVSQILLEHSIPVVSQGSLGLKEHPVIMEIIAFLRFLANPLDENSFCQVLLSRHILPQSFAEECPVQELFEFFTAARKGFLFTAFKNTYPAAWEKYFQVLVDGANLLTAYDTLCEVYKRMGIMERNKDAAVYLLRLKELAYLAEDKGIVDIQAFLDWWEENGEKENAPLPEGLESVSVLTMHKSKGLEYEAVIIPWHNFKIDVQDDICQFQVEFENKKYPMYAKLEKMFGEPYYHAIAEKIKECINLVYVAWTRAKQELHIFLPAEYSTQKHGTFYRFIKAFLERLKEDVQDLSFEANVVHTDKNYTPLVSDKILHSSEYVFAESADCLHAGEKSESGEPVVPEKILRSLEYIFELCEENEKKKIEKYLSKAQLEKLTVFFDEYTEVPKTKTSREKHKNSENENAEQEKTPKLKIPGEDVSYIAKWLSRLLSADEALGRKTKPSFSDNASSEEYSYDQKHLMDWLPQLRIFRSDLDELCGAKKLSANKRGTIVHKSLEYLIFSGNIPEDCRRACFEAMKYLPYGRFLEQSEQEAAADKQEQKRLYENVQMALLWFASLKEPFGGAEFWFKYGYKEHGITNDRGDLFRVDLLVEIPEEMRRKYQNIAYIAVDYKTGYENGSLPVPENKKQILNYIDLLTKATGKKAVGVLIYLDRAECCIVESE